MGEVMTEFRSLTWRSLLPLVLGIAVFVGGCASSSTSPSAEESATLESTTFEVADETAVSLRSLDLEEAASGSLLALRGDGPLVWTSYRDGDGVLVIELPNTIVDPSVTSFTVREGLVSEVDVMAEADAGRPLTRLRVSTRSESEHTVTSTGDVIEIRLLPLGAETELMAAVDGDRQADAIDTQGKLEPLPEYGSEVAEPVVIADAATDASSPEAAKETGMATAPGVGLGTPDDPWVGTKPQGIQATRLDSVTVKQVGTASEVLLSGDGGFEFSSFMLEDPPRFVLDLHGVADLTPQSLYTVDGADLSQVRVAQFQSRPIHVARVVLDLEGNLTPRVIAGDGGLTIRLGETPPQPLAMAEVPAAAVAADDQPGGDLPVEVAAELPAEPIRIEAVTAAMVPEERSPIVLDSESLATQDVLPPTEDAWVGEISQSLVSDVALFEAQDAEIPTPAMVGQPEAGSGSGFPSTVMEGQSKQYYGETMSLSLKDADIKDVLRSFAKISGLNVVVQPGVRGSVTVELESVPWDQALEQILKVNQLGMVLEGNILRIAPVTVLRQEAQEEARLRAAQTRSQPLRTVIKRLSYANARDIMTLMTARSSGVRVMSSRGKISVDNRTNTLIIKELPTYMDTVISIIEHLDSPEPQVMIEARIVETVKSLSRTLGIEWGFLGFADQAHGTTTGLQFPATATGAGGVNLLGGGNAGVLGLSLSNLTGSFNLDMTLQAFESQGLVNVLSAPRIATLNNERASIQSGLQIPVQTVRNNTVTVQYINATLRLEVTPQVTAEGTILMDISVQKRQPDLAFAVVGATNAPINTKEARTSVMVRDGGTTVIGGIYEISADKGEDRVPGLANIPILGSLFRNSRKTQENKELLIFITPRIIQF